MCHSVGLEFYLCNIYDGIIHVTLFYIAAKQLGRKCSKEAVVTAQARLPEKQMTEILAEEEGICKYLHTCNVKHFMSNTAGSLKIC